MSQSTKENREPKLKFQSNKEDQQLQELKEGKAHTQEAKQGQQQNFNTQLFNKDIQIVNKLELFCGLPLVTDAISSFNQSYAQFFKNLPEQGQQDLKQYQAYMKYADTIDKLLSSQQSENFSSILYVLDFLQQQNLSEQEVMACLQRLRQLNSDSLMCLDVILAAIYYQEFCIMMNQYYVSFFVKSGQIIIKTHFQYMMDFGDSQTEQKTQIQQQQQEHQPQYEINIQQYSNNIKEAKAKKMEQLATPVKKTGKLPN